MTAENFLESMFEFEYCSECGGDIQDHIGVIDPIGNWFAYCNNPRLTKENVMDRVFEETPLEVTEHTLNHILNSGRAEESNRNGTYSRGYSDAFSLVTAAQSVVRAEATLNRVVGSYKQL